MVVVKKYSNRRLYDTEDSRYITLDELAEKIRGGTDVQVVDAKSGSDLTQATLTQLILEGAGARLLPVTLLHQLIRMQDDALGEFFSKYVTAALELYLAAKDGVSMFPFASMPIQATSAFMRLFTPRQSTEVEALRREVADLRQELERNRGRRT
jgi:polyhydroxyalkanoate synthesis repressor PhaR